MPEIKQFAITLFNLKLWDKDKVHRSTRTDEWMEERVALFEKYCFPAMSGQTLQDFTWICLLDKDTPDRYTAKLESLRKICPQLTPVFFSE